MFKKNKGFTLIELLAVIVILAILLVIAVPRILDVIEQSRKSAAKSSALGYIKAINYNNKLSKMGQDGYQAITSGSVSDINVKISGDAPSFGTVAVDENGRVSTAILCVVDHLVIYDGSNATVGDKCSSDSSTPSEPRTCEQFAADSWTTIALNTYELGCEKELVLDVNDDGENETYHIQVVNNTTPSECSGNDFSQSACGMVYQFKELLNITNDDDKKMNLSNTNVGGWPASKMYTYLNTTIYNKLPSDLKSMIKTTKVISGHGKTDTENFISYDKLYLILPKEIGYAAGAGADTSDSLTRKLDYYSDIERQSSYDLRIKYIYGTSTADYWWTRSSMKEGVWFLSTDENGQNTPARRANYSLGVSPVFRLGLN